MTPPRTIGRQPAYPYDRGLSEEDVRRIARAEARALLTSVDARNVYPPQSIPRRTVDRVPVVTALPTAAVEGDEVYLQTSTGSIVPFIYLSGAWKSVGSAFQKVTHAIASGGGLPLDGEFTKEFDDTILEFFMAGSGFRPGAAGAGLIGMNLVIASVTVANITVFCNTLDAHEAFVSRTYTHPSTALGTSAYAAGTYDLDVTAYDANTSSDSNDTFYVTVTEKFAETV